MQLTKKDRLMLINQYEILSLLDTDNKAQYAENIEILREGFEIFYGSLVEWVSDDMPQEESRFVMDVLSIYRSIEHYKKENPEDTEVVEHAWSFFRGFDGNEETSYYTFTKFLIDTQGKFVEQVEYKKQNDYFNSHWPSLEKYGCMIEKWKELGKDLSTRETILQVLQV